MMTYCLLHFSLLSSFLLLRFRNKMKERRNSREKKEMKGKERKKYLVNICWNDWKSFFVLGFRICFVVNFQELFETYTRSILFLFSLILFQDSTFILFKFSGKNEKNGLNPGQCETSFPVPWSSSFFLFSILSYLYRFFLLYRCIGLLSSTGK